MIRYRYVQHLTPPAPFVYVSARCPATNQALNDVPAQVDTAADRTVLPDSIIQSLSLVEDGRFSSKVSPARSSSFPFISSKFASPTSILF
jgi:hypothetical protein